MITRVPAKGHEQASTSQGEPNASMEESSFKLFSDSDIMIATNNLSKESVIGRGGFGNVHKGTIVNTEVAIKILDTKGTQGANEFIQEIAVLKNLKHENLVKLMGACLELRALVYEFLPRGSLEDCLNDSPQLLTWQIRTRIVNEICSVLRFLHSMKPKPLVHGDLKPQNILLDADLHCRLSDFGLCRILSEFSETTGAYLYTKSINGTECYMDPDYVEHEKLTPGCDVFSFGVTILRILTGQRPLKIRRKIRKASRNNSLMTIVDSTAGAWPVEVAEYLAKSGLDCCKENRDNLNLMTELSTFIENLAEKGFCEMSWKCQPDLVGEVPRVLEPTMEANSSSVSTLSSGSDNADNSAIPSYFLSQPLQPSDDNYKKKKNIQNSQPTTERIGSTSQRPSVDTRARPSFKPYSKEEIRDATDNFSDSFLLGKGGYGAVYKCTLDNWDVAVKILAEDSEQGLTEYIKEMEVLTRIRHENLVQLMGTCFELRALVYECLPNGSLEYWLRCRPTELTWQIRTRIVYEICKVIMYLHAKQPQPLVHGDIKPHNVLLDDGFHVKLSDFGLCRTLTQGQASTLHISGSAGYMDPDYLGSGRVTPGVDVYALGKTVARVLTGKQPWDGFKEVHVASKRGSLKAVVDPTVRDWPENVVRLLARFALRSCKPDRYRSEFMRNFYSDLGEILDGVQF